MKEEITLPKTWFKELLKLSRNTDKLSEDYLGPSLRMKIPSLVGYIESIEHLLDTPSDALRASLHNLNIKQVI